MSTKRVNRLLEVAHAKGGNGFLVSDLKNLTYFSGYTGEGVILASEKGQAIITDGRYTEQAAQQAPGYEVIEYIRGQYEATMYDTAVKLGIQKLCYEADVMTCSAYNSIGQAMINIELIPTTGVGKSIRIVKDADELALMRRAADITDTLFGEALKLSKPGVTEKDIETELLYIMGKQYGAQSAFDMIIAGGEHGSMPHAVTGSRPLKAHEMVTLDFGAALQGYNSDMTRTYSLGEPSDKMNEIYQIVCDAQAMAEDALKPGMSCREIDAIARDHITKYGYGEYFGHGLGHGVGLDVHEFPVLSTLSKDILDANMVVTIEPGIYLPGIGGVRIENTCIITEDGADALFHTTTKMIII